uniref:Uncharacterized protein n=1 Tax=Chaetoceros debilis TaxID=122233 RepID=A0A7S3VGK9_9STRA
MESCYFSKYLRKVTCFTAVNISLVGHAKLFQCHIVKKCHSIVLCMKLSIPPSPTSRLQFCEGNYHQAGDVCNNDDLLPRDVIQYSQVLLYQDTLATTVMYDHI